jgi:hypothetical protein
VTVPEGYECVGSGQLTPGDVSLRDVVIAVGGRSYVFNANEPVRYFAIVASKLSRVSDVTIDARDSKIQTPATFRSEGRPGVRMRRYDHVTVAVEANPRQAQSRTRSCAAAADIMRFYGTLMDDTPYESLTVTMLEHDLPGGHSPATSPSSTTPRRSRGCIGATTRPPSPAFPSTSWRMRSRTSGGARPLAGRTITSSG